MRTEEKVEKFRLEHEASQSIFGNYCSTVSNILKSLLKKSSIQYQVISSRVKDFSSIENKVLSGSLPQDINSIYDIDDVAGCRVIFYLESDIQKFLSLLYDEFSVEKYNLRYSKDDYNAVHLVVRLSENRLELMEYEEFKGLKCEIQLTTVLFHAWSEMSHNIIYKLPKELSEFDEKSVNALKKQFGEVMENQIKPASYTFEFINQRFQKLQEGKKVFDIDFLQSIIFAPSRNEIYEKMSLLHQFIIEFGDKTPTDFNLVEFIPKVIQKSEEFETVNVETAFGSFRGFEHHYVVEICLNILNRLRYLYTEEVLDILLELAVKDNPKIREKSIQILGDLCKYNLRAMEKIGYIPQMKVVLKLKQYLNCDIDSKAWNVMKNTFKNLLKLEFTDFSLDSYNEISIRTGTVGLNSHLKTVRKQVIDLLKNTYKASLEIGIKVEIIQLLMEVTKPPRATDYNQEINELIRENINDIIGWFLNNFNGLQLPEIKVIDKNLYRLKQLLPESADINKIDSLLKENTEYEIFKTLVGSDTSYGREIGWRESEELRKEKRGRYQAEINAESFPIWEKRILSISTLYTGGNMWEFKNFKTFLFEIGKDKPSLANNLITKNEEELKKFLPDLIAGIFYSSHSCLAKQLLTEWVVQSKHLEQCAATYDLIGEYDLEVMERLFLGAAKEGNVEALFNLLHAIIRNKTYYKQLSSLFLQVVRELSNHGQHHWTSWIWSDEDTIFNYLSDEDLEVLLHELETYSSIGFQEEEVLKPACIRMPERVIVFFERRIAVGMQKQNQSEKGLGNEYDAVPHSFHTIDEILRNEAERILPQVFRWFDKTEWLYQWEGAQLIKNIFPEFEKPLQEFLNALISNGEEKDARNVLKIIKEYEGSPLTFNVCKNLIRSHAECEELMGELMDVLAQTGVVSGNYGFVEVYVQIKREVRKWEKKEKSQEIRAFVAKFMRYINSLIVHATQRADKNVEMMKIQYEGTRN